MVVNWTFLASRARALPCIAHDPEVRVRDFAASGHHRTQRLQHRYRPGRGRLRGRTYEVKQKNRRRNRYQTRTPDATGFRQPSAKPSATS